MFNHLPTMNEKELRELLPCINSTCDKHGTIMNDDGEPEQCEFCYRFRFPVIDSMLARIRERDERLKESGYIVGQREGDAFKESTWDELFAIIDNYA